MFCIDESVAIVVLLIPFLNTPGERVYMEWIVFDKCDIKVVVSVKIHTSKEALSSSSQYGCFSLNAIKLSKD